MELSKIEQSSKHMKTLDTWSLVCQVCIELLTLHKNNYVISLQMTCVISNRGTRGDLKLETKNEKKNGMYLMVRKIYLLTGNFLLNFRKNYLLNQLSGKFYNFRNNLLAFRKNSFLQEYLFIVSGKFIDWADEYLNSGNFIELANQFFKNRKFFIQNRNIFMFELWCIFF